MVVMAFINAMKTQGHKEGKVKVARVGAPKKGLMEKISDKCDADIKAIDGNGGKLPAEKITTKSGKEYRKRYMWRGANKGERQINFVIDNIRWDKSYSYKVVDDAESVRKCIADMKNNILALSDEDKERFQNEWQQFQTKHKAQLEAKEAKRKKRR